MNLTSFPDWMVAVQLRCEQVCEQLLPTGEEVPKRLHQAMRYAVLDGGKRIRPLLVFAAGSITDAPLDKLEVVASAIELIHCYSLVHDDLPCMDDDDLRRGRPSCHIRYDEATALLVGDGLQALAFQALVDAKSLLPEEKLKIISLFADAASSKGMVGGQSIDLTSSAHQLDLRSLEEMHHKKTGALIKTAVVAGGLCGHADPLIEQKLTVYAKNIGLMFQVVDDVLDVTTDSQTLGKTAGKDAASGKKTFVSLMGVDAARNYADSLFQTAMQALLSFDERALRLRQLTEFICNRTF